MPAQLCSRCSRANPQEAQYCYFDGAILNGNGASAGPVNIGAQPFANKFVFPSGKACMNFDQLAIACQEDWKGAIEVLKQGYLESFLAGMGRGDLAGAAKEAARFPDRDRGLDQFLAKLPTDAVKGPKLYVEPTDVSLGVLEPGKDRKLELRLENRGMRLLYGTVSVDAPKQTPWLAVGEGSGSTQKLFQFGQSLTIPIQVKSKYLRASNKPIVGKLVVDSNNGPVEVFIRGEMPVKPYVGGLFNGAKSPRQLAEKAKANPKEAAPVFESGEVAKWYKQNGWNYPVVGPTASGLGAVQQYFEALGLTPPPKVEISEKAVELKGNVGEQVVYNIEVKASEKRPVYAHGSCDASWLEVGKARLDGRRASIPLTVRKVPDSAQPLKTKVTVVANGNQKFSVQVALTAVGGRGVYNVVETPKKGAAAAAATIPASSNPDNAFAFSSSPSPAKGGGELDSPIMARRSTRPSGNAGLKLLPALALVFALGGVVAWDFIRPGDSTVRDAHGDGVSPWSPGSSDLGFKVNNEPLIHLQFGGKHRFGISMDEADPNNPAEKKRLTYHANGLSNNTCLKVDGYDYLFGNKPPGNWRKGYVPYKPDSQGKVVSNMDGGPEEIVKGRKWRSTMKYDKDNVWITQTVTLVPTPPTEPDGEGRVDTCFVHYLVENKAQQEHTVGLRVLFDTYIGANDGVPFNVPGLDDLMTTMHDFRGQKEVPDYVQAFENPDPASPKTVAHLGLRLPKDLKLHSQDPDLEEMVRFCIMRWPGNSEVGWNDFIDKDPQVRGKESPFAAAKPINDGAHKDSAVVMYWDYRRMAPGERRAMAFTYGLGQVTQIEGSSALALTYGGSPKPGASFTVTALVKDQTEGQTVTVILPDGMSLASGESEEKRVTRGDKYGQASWKVNVASGVKDGRYKIEAASGSSRAKVSIPVRNNYEGIFGGSSGK